jgi:hypothetical protein
MDCKFLHWHMDSVRRLYLHTNKTTFINRGLVIGHTNDTYEIHNVDLEIQVDKCSEKRH